MAFIENEEFKERLQKIFNIGLVHAALGSYNILQKRPPAAMYVFSPPLLCGLQLLGLLPVSVSHVPLRGDVARYSKMRTLYSVLLVILYSVLISYFTYKSIGGQMYVSQTTFKITSICSNLATFLGSVITTGVAAARVKEKIVLVEKLREIDFRLQHRLGPPQTRKFSLLIISGVLITVIMEMLHLLDLHKNNHIEISSMIIYLTYEYFKMVILFGLLEVMEIILSVRERFKLVNARVLEVVMRTRSRQLMWTVALPCVETFAMPQEMKLSIPGLSEIHWNLCCIVYDINATYSYQLVSIMGFIFVHLVYYPYLMFVLLDNNIRVWAFIGFTTIWLMIVVIELLVLVVPCSWTVKEAEKTLLTVTMLMGNKMAKLLFSELEAFADQLFHRDVEFTACGLFTLQTSIIISVASAVTTYMAIIIQFQESTEDGGTTRATLEASTMNQTQTVHSSVVTEASSALH